MRRKTFLFLVGIGVSILILFAVFLGKEKHQPLKKDPEGVEEMLPLILATGLGEEQEMEMLKAQAVIARTRVKKARQDHTALPKAITQEEMLSRWSEEGYAEKYEKMLAAVEETFAQVITYEDALIYPEYHYVSAGNTRSMKEAYGREDFPYITVVTSQMDAKHQDYIQVFYYSKKEFQMVCENRWNLVGESFEITAQDSGEYVKTIRIDEKTLTGEEFRQGMGIPSPAFTISSMDGHVRIVTRGIGHGFGLSIFGSNEMAKMGATYESILQYYYPGTQVKSE